MISFVGAGPGAADLLTLRAVDRLAGADVVVWASSLVSPEVLRHCRPGVEAHDSKVMTLDEVTAVYAAHPDAAIVRLHSGDPSIYGAIGEQVAWCLAQQRDFEIVPGVSSLGAAAAAFGRELTSPGLAQSVVLTRLAHRTAASVPDRESVASFARMGATMALFLSAARPEALQAELVAAGSAYSPSTPALIAHRVSRPDERLVPTTVGRLADDLQALGATTTVLVLVGEALGRAGPPRHSHVYAPDYAHSFRPARPDTGTPPPGGNGEAADADPPAGTAPSTIRDTPADCDRPAARDAPADREAPADRDALAAGGAPGDRDAPGARDSTVGRDGPVDRAMPGAGGTPTVPGMPVAGRGEVAVVGVSGGIPYGPAAEEALAGADVVVGSARQLGDTAVPCRAEQVLLRGPLEQVLTAIEARATEGARVCVLASGDPGFFGIVRALGARVGPERLAVHPAPSSVALAFARLGLPWDDATVASAHGRPLDDAVREVLRAPKAAVLTAPDSPPEAVGRALVAAGCGDRAVAVASHLGGHREHVSRTDLAGLAAGCFPPMSVVVLVVPGTAGDAGLPGATVSGTAAASPVVVGGEGRGRADDAGPPVTTATTVRSGTAGADADGGEAGRDDAGAGAGDGRGRPVAAGPTTVWRAGPAAGPVFGQPASAFAHRDGMITKAEVRAVVLSKLALPATGVAWDIGAGSGSVGVECARLAPGLRVVAVDRSPEAVAHARANAAAHGVIVEVVEGEAPEVLAGLPAPDRVFVGGGGLAVLDAVLARLRPGGVVVATYTVLERAVAAHERLGEMAQLSVSRAVPIGTVGARLAPENPVFVCRGPARPS